MKQKANVFSDLNQEIEEFKKVMGLIADREPTELTQLLFLNAQIAVLIKQVQVLIHIQDNGVEFGKEIESTKVMN